MVLDEKGIAAMRKVAKIGREVLDIAAAAAVPGVTTDYIDEIVHKACMERDVCALSQRSLYLVAYRVTGLPITTQLPQLSKIILLFNQRSHLSRYSGSESFT